MSIESYDVARFWVNLVTILISGAVWLYAWRANKSSASLERIAKMEQEIRHEMKLHGEQLGRMDERMRQAVGHPDLKPMYERINSMDSGLAEIKGKMHTLDLIHEFLMNERSSK